MSLLISFIFNLLDTLFPFAINFFFLRHKLFQIFIVFIWFNLFLNTGNVLYGQQQIENVDRAFQEARQLAFDGKRAEARDLARSILDITPDYHDVRILLARTYSWDGKYKKARSELQTVINKTPKYKDALSALLDVEIWDEEYEQALSVANTATRYYPTDVDLLVKKATVYSYMDQDQQALVALDQAETLSPGNSQVRSMMKSIKVSRLKNTVSVSYNRDWFDQIFDPWNTGFIQYSSPTRFGTLIGRLGFANRFGSSGFQPEIDFYPAIADGIYGYINFGYSNSSLFPEFRTGSELFFRLPRSFEASAGFRFLNFSSGSVTILTGNLTKYWKNWMFTARPFVTPSSVGISQSINFITRRYFTDADNYISLRGGFGFSPEERRFQDVSRDVFFVKSWFVGAEAEKTIRYNVIVFGSLTFTRQELTFDPGNFNSSISLNTGFRIKM